MSKKSGYLARAETAVTAAQDALAATQTKHDRVVARWAELRSSDDPAELVERRGLLSLSDDLREDIRIRKAALYRETLALDLLRAERADLLAAAEAVAHLPERNAPAMTSIKKAIAGVKSAIEVARPIDASLAYRLWEAQHVLDMEFDKLSSAAAQHQTLLGRLHLYDD